MPDLSFEIEAAEAVPFAAAPLLAFKLRVANAPAGSADPDDRPAVPDSDRGHAPALQRARNRSGCSTCSASRSAGAGRCAPCSGRTPDVVVPPFNGRTWWIAVPCTFDFNVAATKYFAGLEEGELPLDLLFSGTVFYAGRGRGAAGDADLLGARRRATGCRSASGGR